MEEVRQEDEEKKVWKWKGDNGNSFSYLHLASRAGH